MARGALPHVGDVRDGQIPASPSVEDVEMQLYINIISLHLGRFSFYL
jgi:hypothetical protein